VKGPISLSGWNRRSSAKNNSQWYSGLFICSVVRNERLVAEHSIFKSAQAGTGLSQPRCGERWMSEKGPGERNCLRENWGG